MKRSVADRRRRASLRSKQPGIAAKATREGAAG